MSELGRLGAWCSTCECEVTLVAPVSLNAARSRALFDLVLAGGDPSAGQCPRCGSLLVSADPWFCCDFARATFVACVPPLLAGSAPMADGAITHDEAITALLAPIAAQIGIAAAGAVLTLTPDTAATREKLLAVEHDLGWVELESAKLPWHDDGRLAAGQVARLVAIDADRCLFEVYGPGGRHRGVLGELELARSAIDATPADPRVVRTIGPQLRVIDASLAASS